MKTTDFSVPRRMSHSAYVILFGHYLKRCFNILMSFVLLAFFKWELSVVDRLLILLVLLGVNLFLALFLAFFDYYYKQFHIQDGKLIFRHGVFRREVTSIPLCRVQSLRIQQGMLYRLLDLKGLSFDTLASRTEEVEMILDVDDWEALMTQVDTLKADADSPSLQSTLQPTDRATGVTRLTIHNLNLIKGALCQNHLQGMTVLFGILLTLYNQLQSVDDSALFDALDYWDQHASLFTFSLRSLLVLGGFFYLFVLLLWMGKVFFRYYQTTIEINGDQLTFESGLLSRRSSRFSYDKICTLHFKQNFLEKWLHCGTLTLQQALNATDLQRGADVQLYGYSSSGILLDWWLKDYAASPVLMTARSGYGLMGFSLSPKLLLALAVTGVSCHFQSYVGLWLSLAYLLLMVVKDYFAMRRSRIVLKGDYLEIHSGGFAAATDYLKYSNVEVVRLRATPFTPRFHRVRLHLATNGSSWVVRSLKEDEAQAIYEVLLQRCNKARR